MTTIARELPRSETIDFRTLWKTITLGRYVNGCAAGLLNGLPVVTSEIASSRDCEGSNSTMVVTQSGSMYLVVPGTGSAEQEAEINEWMQHVFEPVFDI